MVLRTITISILFIPIFTTANVQGVSSNKISTANGGSEFYNGDYNGDLSIMYFEQNLNSST